jgi:hypothetical protein
MEGMPVPAARKKGFVKNKIKNKIIKWSSSGWVRAILPKEARRGTAMFRSGPP